MPETVFFQGSAPRIVVATMWVSLAVLAAALYAAIAAGSDPLSVAAVCVAAVAGFLFLGVLQTLMIRSVAGASAPMLVLDERELRYRGYRIPWQQIAGTSIVTYKIGSSRTVGIALRDPEALLSIVPEGAARMLSARIGRRGIALEIPAARGITVDRLREIVEEYRSHHSADEPGEQRPVQFAKPPSSALWGITLVDGLLFGVYLNGFAIVRLIRMRDFHAIDGVFLSVAVIGVLTLAASFVFRKWRGSDVTARVAELLGS